MSLSRPPTRIPFPRWPATVALAALAMAAGFGPADAGSLTITVLGTDGQPAANVVVQALPLSPLLPRPGTAPVVITQKDIRFVPYVTAVPVGTTVRFVNADSFDHHLRSQPAGPLGTVPAAKDFEFRLHGATPASVATADVKLDVAGTIVLGCHLHNSMRGHVYVSSTPFVGVTDAAGRVTLADVPEGDATLKVWHPEQVSDQAELHATVTNRAAGPGVSATLNFTPRRRRT